MQLPWRQVSQSRKHRGFRTERVVAEYLKRWWEGATVGRGSGRDILNVPFDCEVKARTGLDVVGTLRQIETRTAESGLLGFACFRLNGQGEKANDYVAMLRLGDLVEFGATEQLFFKPNRKETEDYITGRFG